jgi:cupin fold WbuC family metalloprotein
MIVINNSKILELGQKALESERKRINFNLHSSYEDPLQRIVNVLEPGTYICPHMHQNPDKREIFVILRGSLLVCTFNNNGDVKDYLVLGNEAGNYIVEISSSTWHTIIPLAVHTAVFECKDGPYQVESDKVFAPWAPAEGDPAAMKFNNELLKKLGFVFPEFM